MNEKSNPDHTHSEFQPWIPKNIPNSTTSLFEWGKPHSTKKQQNDLSFKRQDELSFTQPFQSSWGGKALPLENGEEVQEEPVVFSMTQSEYDVHIANLLNQQQRDLQIKHEKNIQLYQDQIKSLEQALSQSLNFQKLRQNQIEHHFFDHFQPAMNALIDFFFDNPAHWNDSLIQSVLKQFDNLQIHSFFIQIHPSFLTFLEKILSPEVFSSYQWIANDQLSVGDLFLVEQPEHHHGFAMSAEQFKQSTIQWMKAYIDSHQATPKESP